MADANSRFFVAAPQGSASVNAVYYSDFNLPFRFRALVQFANGSANPTSGGSYTKSGETIQAIVPVGAVPTQLEQLGYPVAASGLIYILTDRNVYITSGFDALSLNKTIPFLKYGTYSPMSVGIGQTFWYFLANDGQVKRIEGWNAQDISVETVDNLTQNIPTARLPWVWGACANLRYFMACSQSSGGSTTTNANALIYSEVRQKWESFDAFPAAFTGEILLVDYPAGMPRILTWAATPNAYSYDVQSQTTDVGSAGIAIKILTKEFAPGFGMSVFAGVFGCMADIAAGDSLIIDRIPTSGYGDSTNANSSLSLTQSTLAQYSSSTRINRVDTVTAGTEDTSIQISIAGTVPASWKLYEAYINLQSGSVKADKPS